MKVGIIGAGTMGSGIAQAFAQTEGYEVFLCDINEEFAANGKKKIAKGFEKRIAKGKMTQEAADAVLAKITTGVKTICTDCDLVVEAALENMQIKKQMDDFCRGIDLEAKEESADLLGEGVSDILRQILDRTISDAGIPVSAMSRQDKMDIVRFLDEKEVFSIKGSVEELAKQLAVSRYTIYNYLDEVRNRKE